MSTQFEREEDAIAEACNNGEITQSEMNEELRKLYAEQRAYAEEAAQEAYDREMEQW